MEEAIRKSIEGGYEPCEFTPYTEIQVNRKGTGLWGEWVSFSNSIGEACMFDVSKIVLDPKFWQCLGKSLGWKSSYQKDDPEWKTLTFGDMEYRTPHALFLRFMEHIWQGKSADDFFNNLLK